MIDLTAALLCLNPVLTNTLIGQLTCIAKAMLSMSGRVTMLGISRWTNKGGSYRSVQRFFNSVLPWAKLHWFFIRHHLLSKDDVILLAGDETVVTKAGKKTHGLDRFFSSLYGKTVPGISFFVLSFISTKERTSYPVMIEQFVKEQEENQDQERQQEKRQQQKEKKRPLGRPKGSKNKNRRAVELSPQLLMIQTMICRLHQLIGVEIPLVYCLLDGAFGHNNALQMVRQCGLDLISKLRYDAALYFPYTGPQKRFGRHRKYGHKLNYEQIEAKYLQSDTTRKGIRERIYQMTMLSTTFPDPLNVVIIIKTNLKKQTQARVVLFSSDLALGYEKLIDYYRLRFQIEFNFRDAKQYWGLEDFMNVTQRSVYNGANLSLFMVNLSRAMMVDFRNVHPNFSANDLKAHYRGVKYVEEVLKLLPDQAEPLLIEAVFSNVLALGSVNVLPKAA
ncbi:MAG: transposase [Bacteroidetes bacterium]|nr:transposase [Bacteroidota bacterium]